jgi:hypothetical protein
LKKACLGVLLLLVTFVLAELAVRVFISVCHYPDEEVFEAMDQNETRYLAEPFLNYIHNSRYANEEGVYEINSLGLKDSSAISVEKPAGTYRILCLGGSTTYGLVKNARNTFPAQLQRLLNQHLDSLHIDCKRIECLNAGISGATTAEILTHYIFKWKYLKPDLIIVHTGINDAIMYLTICHSQYQPDYHNRKRLFPDIEPMGPTLHFLVKSRAIAMAVYLLKYKKFVDTRIESNLFFKFDNKNEWLTCGNDSMFSLRYNAFYNNIKTLHTIAQGNNQKILLVSEVVDETLIPKMDGLPDSVKTVLYNGFKKNKELLQGLSSELNLPICKLKNEDFPPEYFLEGDFMHVNEKGEAMKAKRIEEALVDVWAAK